MVMRMRYWNEIEWSLLVLTLIVVTALSFVGYVIYSDMTAEKIELTKSDWHCTDSATRTHLQPVTTGKTTSLIPITSNVCIRYERIDK